MELDAETLSQIRQIGGDDLLGRLARLFLEHTPIRFEEIRRGLAVEDWSRTARAIHSIRSSSVTLGAVELAHTAAKLEKMAGDQDRDRLVSALTDLKEQARLASAVLEGLLRKEMGFGGLIITDAMDMHAVAQYGKRKSIRAALAAVRRMRLPRTRPAPGTTAR